jgi:hypothetical protein
MSAMFAQNLGLPAAYCGLNFNFADRVEKRHCADRYSRRALLQGNFIDLNCFVHRRHLHPKAGGFDEEGLSPWSTGSSSSASPSIIPRRSCRYFSSSTTSTRRT